MKTKDSLARNMESTVVLCRERYNVFLGGSCGGRTSPTTWRKEVAIPLLTENDITFFNPQVDTWTHDLIYKENKAKENSDWLLFMLESSTRGIVSLVEVAYCVGTGRSVIFVIQEERLKGQLSIKEDAVSNLESEDIMVSQNTLESIIGRHDCCQYSSVLEKGLLHAIQGLKSNDGKGLVQHGNSFSGPVGERKVWHDWIQKISTVFIGKNKNGTEETHRKKRPSNLKITPFHRYSVGIICADGQSSYLVHSLVDKCSSKRLGLSKDSVYVAQGSSIQGMDSLQQCSLIIVVIPSSALASSAMCKAAYLLSKHKNIVFCIQDVASSVVDNGNTQLSKCAVDDYNRARAYLRDMATNHCMPVDNHLGDTIDTAVSKLCLLHRKHGLPQTPTIPEV